jgi:isocitrate dehydrogenase kinase/phosphatase
VGPHDVFPETFGAFLLGNPVVRDVFMKHHADLLEASFWQAHKERILAGHVHDVFPYDPQRRFARLRAARTAPAPRAPVAARQRPAVLAGALPESDA